MVGWLQVFVVGIPLVFLVGEKTTAAFVVKSGMIFVICTSILCLVYIPKILLVLGSGRDNSNMGESQRRLSNLTLRNDRRRPSFAMRSGATFASDNSDGLRVVPLFEDCESVKRLRKDHDRLKEYNAMLQDLLKEHGIAVPSLGADKEIRGGSVSQEEAPERAEPDL